MVHRFALWVLDEEVPRSITGRINLRNERFSFVSWLGVLVSVQKQVPT